VPAARAGGAIHNARVSPLPRLHRALDRAAMWSEDRVRRAPAPFRAGSPEPLACFGPVTPLAEAPPAAGWWRPPSPRPHGDGDRMAVRIAPARGASRGVALLVPPWKIRHPALVAGWASLLGRAGLEAWLVVPPFHLQRTPRGARGGEGFVSLDLARTRAVLEGFVLELRTLAATAAARGPVGVVGLSLGGLAAALAATGGEPLGFAALVAPADLGQVVTRTPIGRRYRALAARAGTPLPDDAALRALLAPLDPAARAPAAERVFVAAARHDLVAPPEGPLRLAEAWGAEARVYDRGHLTLLLACRAVRRDLAAFLRDGR
jgi:predicted alpha/beta hydrolase family esterase